MNKKINRAFRMFTLLLLFSTLWTAICSAATPEQIFVWVSRQMNIEYVYNMPEVRYVEKQQMQDLFQGFSRKAYEQWQAEFGEKQASVIMADYLKRVAGFFNPETRIIYVGNFLSPCMMQSVLAHESTHYFQNLINGPIDTKDYNAEDVRLFREIEAYLMQAKYKELFCDSDGVKCDKVLAFHY